MKELIKITTNEEGKQLVSARELYIGLGLRKKKLVKVVFSKYKQK